MSDPDFLTPPEPTANRRWHVSPLIFMGAVVVFGFVFLVALITIAGRMKPVKSALNLPVLAEATMDDGSILTLNAVLTGSTRTFEFDIPTPSGPWGSYPQRRQVHAWGQPSQISLVMSRFDPKSMRYLDIDFWKKTTVVDAHQEEIEDDNAQLQVIGAHSHSSSGGERPFQKNVHLTTNDPIQVHFGISALPAFRSGPKAEVRVYDANDKVVATFFIPNPCPVPATEWVPETLPATKSSGDLEVTLKSVNLQKYVWGAANHFSWNVHNEFAFRQGGMETTHWYAATQLSDALGNHAYGGRHQLSHHEPAWKLDVTCYRHANAKFASEEIGTSAPLTLPKEKETETADIPVSNSLQKIRLSRLNGPGEVSYSETSTNGGGYGTNGYLSDRRQYHINREARHTGGSSYSTTTKINSPVPSVIVSDLMHVTNQMTTYSAIDDQEREVPVHQAASYNSDIILMLDTKPDAKQVRLKVTSQVGRTLEFFVAPHITEQKQGG